MSNTTMTTLPSNFTPGDRDVVIGKGKKFYFHPANQWLRTVVAERIESYSQAVTKADKSNIISGVVEYVREHGRFVKIASSGEWIFAEPLLCREKCSQTFRDNLAQTYRSSNVAKRNKRRAEQQEKTNSVMSTMSLYPPAKRVRTTYTPEPVKSVSVNINMEPLDTPPSPNSCATWFDWEMPLLDLQQEENTMADFDGLMLDFSSADNGCVVDDFEPLPATSSNKMKDVSSTSFVEQSSGFRLQDNFTRRSAAAFAA